MMKRDWSRRICGVVLVASVTCGSQVLGSPERGHRAVTDSIEFLAPANPTRPTELEQAYLDSFSILENESRCSEFFGGPSAIAALNQLTRQLHPTRLDRRIGIRMTGETKIVTSFQTGFTFRLFARAEVNLDGPFYRANTSPARPMVPLIGPFEPNTREARATTLLHELGHLIRRPDGQWVLANDGDTWRESEENTSRVIEVCGEQIRALHKLTFAEELAGAQAAASLLTIHLGSGE